MAKCPHCLIKFKPTRFLQKNCEQTEECRSHAIQTVLEKNRKLAEKKEKVEKKDWNEKKAEMKVDTHAKEYKTSLQNEINKLSRMIDLKFEYFTCIDCENTFEYPIV